MNVSGMWALLLIVGAAALVLLYISNRSSNSLNPDMVLASQGDSILFAETSRKLKEGQDNLSGGKNFHMDDYNSNDPVPSSKAAILPVPIEHGTPVIPYIPKPSPSGQPSGGCPPNQSSDDKILTQPGGGIHR